MIESDCLYAMNLVNNFYDSTTHHYTSIIGLCMLELATFNNFKVVHVSSENFAVVRIASFEGQTRAEFVVFDFIPSYLSITTLANSRYHLPT